jgi:predicted transcriptional regulator
MNDKRKSEVVRREEAQAHAGEEIVAGSGRRGKPRRMAQMVSVRLDGELIGKLRIVAEERNATLSDLLREGAELIVEDAYASARPRTSFTISGAQEALHETASGRALAAH